ncbi:hypothetical protein ACFYM2_18155 [Streptomyces sp. NPDC006711]|uniref:hypothetical protein n=1 Tax=Streptomyces sp. NPDC006711 TaxID=3364762 RepID=UPI0036C94DA1
MNLRGARWAVALAAVALILTGCGMQKNDGTIPGQVSMDDQQAIARAEEILHQAVDGMTPRPTLKVVRPASVGPCLAYDDHTEDDRVQVRLGYQLTGVPGTAAKSLVKQAAEAWRKLGYAYQSSAGAPDWSDPFPTVFLRTKNDDFWMDATAGVLDRAKGEGLAAITVTSPCFQASGGSATPATHVASLHAPLVDPTAERRALGHSSRIYDALRTPHAQIPGDGLRPVNDHRGRAFLHHTWSAKVTGRDEATRAVARGQAYFEAAGWVVRRQSAAALRGLNPDDHSVAQIAADDTGMIRVAVTTPVLPVASPRV